MTNAVTFKRAWNRLAQTRAPGVTIFGPVWGPRYQRGWDQRDFQGAEALLHVTAADRLLDVGCGPLARAEVYFGQRGCRVVGVDVSATAAAQAQRCLKRFHVEPTVDLVVADAEHLPFRPACFHKVLAAGLLVHLPTKPSVARALRQFAGCLEAGGLCYIIWLPNLYSLFGPVFQLVTRLGQLGRRERIQLLTFHGLAEVRRLCRHAGFVMRREFPSSILWIGFYLFPTCLHRYLEKLVTALTPSRPTESPTAFLPYSFDVVAQRL